MRGTAQPGGNTVTNGEIESHFIPLPDSKDPIAFEKINLQQIALTLLFFAGHTSAGRGKAYPECV